MQQGSGLGRWCSRVQQSAAQQWVGSVVQQSAVADGGAGRQKFLQSSAGHDERRLHKLLHHVHHHPNQTRGLIVIVDIRTRYPLELSLKTNVTSIPATRTLNW